MSQKIESSINRKLNKKINYYYANSGMAVYLTAKEAKIVSSLTGIVSVEKDKVYQLDTDVGTTFISADQIWNGHSTPSNVPIQGEGIVVGVIATGLKLDHQSL